MRKLTTESFIRKAKEIHGDKYDYSKVDYKGINTKVVIICPVHGEFLQTPRSHLQGGGCNKCSHELLNLNNTKTLDDFIEKAKEIHGDKYDYSKAVYNGCLKKVCIICPEHGEFWQTPDNHIHGHGCRRCLFDKLKEINSSDADEFIKKAKEIHGDKYDYSSVKYTNCDTLVKIICPVHGEFLQTPYNHLHGSSCPNCRNWKLEEEISKELDRNSLVYIRQKRFSWLGRQSLDFYLPDYNLAIECQGDQHFKPVKYWGGIEKFKQRKELDLVKKNKCEENNVTLLYYSNKKWNNNVIVDKDKLIRLIKESNML